MSGQIIVSNKSNKCVICGVSHKREDPILFYYSRYNAYFHKTCFEDFTCKVADGSAKWSDIIPSDIRETK